MFELSKEYETLLNAIAGLMVIDKNAHVIYMNEQCANYINVNKEESIGKPLLDVFPTSTMQNLLHGEKERNTQFYLNDDCISVSTQVQLREGEKIIGVLEYDIVQDIDNLDDLMRKYARSLVDEVEYYRSQRRNLATTKYSIDDIIGSSPQIRKLKDEIGFAANSTSTVIIEGETGTGKELVAQSIHSLSMRGFNSFVKVNAAGMPETLIESELFGYEEGAFTGARKGGKKGKFLLADNGTLFIDEINQMPLSVQPKVLRALQEGEISPVGGEMDIPVDVRIIVATNQQLFELMREGKFREDLYYRLNVFPIKIPPLRERKEDIPELVEAKIKELNKYLNKSITRVEPAVYDRLMSYNWPGNVRELHNRIESAMNYAQEDVLCAEHFDFKIGTGNIDLLSLENVSNPIETIKREAERGLITKVLAEYDNNKSKTAKYLNISRPLLYQKMKRLGIDT